MDLDAKYLDYNKKTNKIMQHCTYTMLIPQKRNKEKKIEKKKKIY